MTDREEIAVCVHRAVRDALDRAGDAVAALRNKRPLPDGPALEWYRIALDDAEQAVRACKL